MGEEAPDVGVTGRSNSVSMLASAGADGNLECFCLTCVRIVRRVSPVEGAIWVIVLVIPHLARSPITRQ